MHELLVQIHQDVACRDFADVFILLNLQLLGSILGASGGRMFGRFSCWSPPPVRPQYDPLEELQQDPLRSLNGPGVTLLACQDINLHDLPALRQRGPNYYWGPWCRSCIFVCLAVGLAAEHDRVRLCLVVVFAFIFESVGLPHDGEPEL